MFHTMGRGANDAAIGMSKINPLMAVTVFAVSILSACGGGGGGHDSPPVLTLSAAPTSVQTGQTTTVTWNAEHATSCVGSGSWIGDFPVAGSLILTLPEAGQYIFIMTCTGSDGSDTQTATVTASGSPATTMPISLTADPTSVAVGKTTTLTWSADGASGCVASGEWTGSKAASGSEVVTINAAGPNQFRLDCTGTDTQGSQEISVTGLLPHVSLASDVDVVKPGTAATLTWSSENATACSASGDWSGDKTIAGSEAVSINGVGTYHFTLNCSDGLNATSQTVEVSGAAPAVTLSAFPSNVVVGKTITLRWHAEYADGCTASGAWGGALPVEGSKTVEMTSTGALTFHLSCSNPATSTPADAAATVAAAPDFAPATAYRMNESHDGVVLTKNGDAKPAATAPAWTIDLGATVSYPLIANGMVFVATTNPNGSYGNRLYGLNATTGAVVWGPVAVPGTYFGSGLTYDNGRVFILMFDGAIRSFNAANGAAQWSTQLPGYWYEGSPNAYGGIVFIVGNGGLSAVDEKTGAILWTTSGGTTDFVSPAVSSEGVYYMDGYYCGAFASAVDTGALIWQQNPQCSGPFGYTSIIKNGVFYGRAGASVNLLDAHTGATRGQLASAAAPAVTDTAFIALNSGTLSATRLSDLAPSWTFSGDGTLATAPVVVDNTVYVGAASGKVYGLDVTSGLQTWLGTSPVGIAQDSESGGPQPPLGPAAGENLLVFPAGNSLVAWRLE